MPNRSTILLRFKLTLSYTSIKYYNRKNKDKAPRIQKRVKVESTGSRRLCFLIILSGPTRDSLILRH